MTRLPIPFLALTLLCSGAPAPRLTASLLTTLPSPQPVGTAIGLLPHIENASTGMHVFRYSASTAGGPFHILRDFSQRTDFVWSPDLYEHDAKVRVTVRNNENKETAEAELPFRITSRVKGPQAVVTPTFHPLIALYSAPACPEGSQFRVAFQRRGESISNHTQSLACRSGRSNNVYVAGMRADADYQLRDEILKGSEVKRGTWMPFHTGPLDGDFPPVSIPVPYASASAVSEPVLIHGILSMGGLKRPFATNMDGDVIWYLRSPEILNRVLPGGRFLVHSDGPNSANDMERGQIVREMDLVGNVLRETNISRVAEQLHSLGIHSDCKAGAKECVSGFHHEAIRLPNGHTLSIAGLERMMPPGTQGSKEPVDILGDLVIDLDQEFQVAGVWNSFDHVDLKRASLGGAKCKQGRGNGGCPAIFLAPEANGWLHSNSLNYIPASGDFLISLPEQDWVLKIDWRDGKGTGKVLWRLGEGGDFTAQTADPNPWFSYQHDAGFEPVGSNLLSILDDGHARKKKDPSANNRGQVWKLDENAHTATLVLNADLGVYSIAVGSAQSLKNGGYSFEAGLINRSFPFSRAVETSPDGKIVYVQQLEGYIEYRSFRVKDMYSASVK